MTCGICGEGMEDLEHFVVWCRELQEIRNEIIKLQRPVEEDVEDVIGVVIFDERCEDILYKMWRRRREKLRERI